jgi:hypothetical protein
MAKDRLSLHSKLVEMLGSPNVYFQPPPTIVLKYPCIIYKLDDVTSIHANNLRYSGSKRYLLTFVDKNPDTTIYEKVFDLPYSAFETSFIKDNLNQHICSLYW